MIFGGYSKDFPDHPATSQYVRIKTHWLCFWVEEHKDEKGPYVNMKFAGEIDFGISQFLYRNLGPKQSNYAYMIQKYWHKTHGRSM